MKNFSRWDRAPLMERFLDKIEPEPNSGCWLWLADRRPNGYARIGVGRKVVRAHRVAHELFKGPIPDGFQIDHRCRVPACVNPAHLEAVTQQINRRRASEAITHCPAGHPYEGRNLITDRRGHRSCRECRRIFFKRINQRPHRRRRSGRRRHASV